MLTLEEYQLRAGETAIYPGREITDGREGLHYLVPGLAAEAGELAGHWAKAIRDDNGALSGDRYNLIRKELGDILWFVAMIADELMAPLESVASENLAKLADRAERGVLQGSGDNR
ncbi:nucleoside triphosphate pyrophosphohydrolase family protein [Puerhibacterium puerhi]|uniref:nucleoside triphosphate pyrophosphohydrolase family protein n=1 Tax=Puerhibacterium puerhi TaxID=2692623 RepID=UPI001914E726|nr:nucleoside triphosphate pyrophosphohydrolase family protein [Puerhibacterium puerhi]